MINLGSWMNGILIGWGVDPKIGSSVKCIDRKKIFIL